MQAVLKTTYSVPQLAEMLSLSRFQMLRLLKRERVPMTRLGRNFIVSLEAFRSAFPDLWKAILLRAALEEGEPL